MILKCAKSSFTTAARGMNVPENTNSRIESELEVLSYIQNLRYALNNGARINIQLHRSVDEARDVHFTNRYTIDTLFPNQEMSEVLKRELASLTVEDYIQTVTDLRFPSRSEMREFGKVYREKGR